MNGFSSFTELVRRRAAAYGEQVAYTFLPDDPAAAPESITYGELDRRARAIAAGLQARGLEGQRALMLYPSSLRFIEAFLGCLYAGVTAVPAPLPAGQMHHVDRLVRIAQHADVRLVLTVADAVALAEPLLVQAGIADVECVATDATLLGRAEDWAMPAIDGDTLAFLQYTSGSTGSPRGVMVDHRNLLHNSGLIEEAFLGCAHGRSGGWLPFYHDMGLIGQVLNPLYAGGTSTLMSPSAFLRNPFRWLETIQRYGLQITGGPNFAYDLCVRRVKDEQIAGLDLSGWEIAFNGAEPVRAETMRAFARRFAPAGFNADAFYPCYGMAETTLFVSGRGRAKPTVTRAHAAELERGTLRAPALDARAVELVGSGRLDGLELVVVDPETRAVLPDGSVGELWIRGESVSRGYWRDPESTDEVFGAMTATGEGPFVRSGDLGALTGGELYVTGRCKEIVIVNGRNLYPQDIEQEVREAHPALAGRTGAAFSLEAAGERLVVVQELSPAGIGEATPEEVVNAVKERLGTRLGLRPSAVVLVAPRSVLRTTSGKIQRRLMRSAFITGALDAVHADVHPTMAASLTAEAA